MMIHLHNIDDFHYSLCSPFCSFSLLFTHTQLLCNHHHSSRVVLVLLIINKSVIDHCHHPRFLCRRSLNKIKGFSSYKSLCSSSFSDYLFVLFDWSHNLTYLIWFNHFLTETIWRPPWGECGFNHHSIRFNHILSDPGPGGPDLLHHYSQSQNYTAEIRK